MTLFNLLSEGAGRFWPWSTLSGLFKGRIRSELLPSWKIGSECTCSWLLSLACTVWWWHFRGSWAKDTATRARSTSAIQGSSTFHMIEKNNNLKTPERGEDKEDIKKAKLFADKPRAETLMNTGCAVFGQDRTSVSRCFQVLPSHFSGDHPFDPILIPSQRIIQPKSTTSQQYGVIIHISLWLHTPERKGRSWMYCCYCTLSPFSVSLSLCLCLFWFEGTVEGYSTERVLHTSIGLKIDLAGFLRHRRRILASHTTTPPTPPSLPLPSANHAWLHRRDDLHANTAWNNSFLPHLHHNMRWRNARGGMNTLLRCLGGSCSRVMQSTLSGQRHEEKLEKQAALQEESVKIDRDKEGRYKDVFLTMLMENHVAMTTHFLHLFMLIMACWSRKECSGCSIRPGQFTKGK